ncbi:DNA helicase II [Thiohalomonas denitrificans]|uniref:DNA helicase II n=1 Tax=Thiohalomonas denitrificans TaxID=415747 RepID=UPI0026EF8400|nr:DNA helicase II [Thiohalomonas denitrificans]
MDVSDLIDPLNEAQRQAVCAPAGNLLVLAGAGSGKTRVLTHRIAWLIRTEGVSPFGILAVTFTNKAAREMRGRIESLLQVPAGGMWVGTFHGIAHRLLRQHWREADLPQSFQILDSDDQYRMVRRVLRELQLDETNWPPKQAQWFINGRKDEGLRPEHVDPEGNPVQMQLVRIYQAYEQACRRGGVVDFAELLLRAHELWRDRPDLLAHYRERFRHILVDEFQDTNAIQYAWIRLLAGDSGQVFVVGDDDQSIYGWRGARVENIHQFRRDFPNVQLIRLEQNYRSTGTILSAANGIIAHNADRLGKELWTAGEKGDPVRIYGAFNEIEEARFVVDRIRTWNREGGARSEVAILYRSNAQSRVLEEALMQAAVPYRVYGGLRFFDRAEIKDALAYLRLIVNRGDDPSFERVVNTPTRGIGDRTVQAIREHAAAHQQPLWQAAMEVAEGTALPARARNAVRAFLELVECLAEETEMLELHDTFEHAVTRSGLIEHCKKEKGERGQARIENLEELVNAARQFEFDEEQHEGMSALSAFLAHAALEAGEGQADEWEDSVQLMTLHSAKGLEFPLVFICGMEEGLFPHRMSVEEPGRLEEERRLCYVGMTRAMRQLYLTYAEVRRLYGQENYTRPSRFLRELPPEFVEEIRLRGMGTAMPSPSRRAEPTETADGLGLGQRVTHRKFGEGVILALEGQGAQARVQVAFDDVGTKWLVLSYANLEAV